MRAWNEVVLARAAELRATAEWLARRQQATPQPGVDRLLEQIREHLAVAEAGCDGVSGPRRLRSRRRLNGADVDLAADARGNEVLEDVRGGGRAPASATVSLPPPHAPQGAVVRVETR